MQSDVHSGAYQDYDHDHYVGPLLESDRRKLFSHSIALSLYTTWYGSCSGGR